MGEQAGASSRRRGRPSRSAGVALTRELIARRALEIAGDEGFSAVTMHRLARELGVSPRALYNHVEHRQDVIDAVGALMMQELPVPHLDPAHWRESLRDAYRDAREAYRKYPRALLLAMDETLTLTGVDPARIHLAEHMLRFFVDIGLSLEQAVAARGAFLTDVFGFSLVIDYRYDRSDPAVREMIGHPVPRLWLDAMPQVPAPLSREAASLPSPSSDEMFEMFVELRITAIDTLLGQGERVPPPEGDSRE